MKEILIVGLGGFLGSVARYGVARLAASHYPDKTYISTLVVNMAGCLLIGLVSGSLVRLNQQQHLLLVTGLLGGFTTFSAFTMDGLRLVKAGMHSTYLLYTLTTIVGGFLLCYLGFLLSNRS